MSKDITNLIHDQQYSIQIPNNEALQAEAWLKNEDAGFVHAGQMVKVKLMAYPFQKYGMVDGKILQVSADATDKSNSTNNQSENQNTSGPTTQLAYRTIVQLDKQHHSIEQVKTVTYTWHASGG